jgi:hypothetical protein
MPRTDPIHEPPESETPLTDEVMEKLKIWCDRERGRRSAFARHWGYKPQIVTDWFSKDHRRMPTSEQFAQITQFLKDVELLERLSVWISEAAGSEGVNPYAEIAEAALAATYEKVAKHLVVSSKTVASWFAPPLESRHPTKNQIEAIEKFLAKQ